MSVVLGQHGELGTGSWLASGPEPRHLVPVALLCALAGALLRERRRGLALALGVGIPALVLVYQLGIHFGVTHPYGAFDRDYHVVFDRAHTPLVLSLLAAGGVVILLVRDPRRAIFLVGTLATCGHLYIFFYDCPSTWVRSGLGIGALWMVAAGVAASSLLDRLPRRDLASWLAIAGIALSGVCFQGWLGAAYPKQVAWALLEEARGALPEDAVVVHLANTDLPDEVDGFRVQRGDYARYLGGDGRSVVSARSWATRTPEERVGHFVYCGPACFQLPMAAGGRRAWIDGRWVELRTTPQLASSDQPRETPGFTRRDYEDPACRAWFDDFDLEPVVERPLGSRLAGSVYEQSFHEDARIGLYRVVGASR